MAHRLQEGADAGFFLAIEQQQQPHAEQRQGGGENRPPFVRHDERPEWLFRARGIGRAEVDDQ